MVVSNLTSSKYWDIGENCLNWTHLRPNSRLSQKQNASIDAFTMVHQSSHRHIQAVMNIEQSLVHNCRLLGCKEIFGFGLTHIFLRLVHKQSVLECNTLQTSYRVQYTQAVFLSKMLGGQDAPVGTRFSTLETRIGSLKHLKKTCTPR